jgi:hypothetical protein
MSFTTQPTMDPDSSEDTRDDLITSSDPNHPANLIPSLCSQFYVSLIASPPSLNHRHYHYSTFVRRILLWLSRQVLLTAELVLTSFQSASTPMSDL